MAMRRSMEGRTALVTGAARGIGRALAEELGLQGCSVFVLDVTKESLERAVAELGEKGIKATAIHCDLSDLDQIASAVEFIRGSGGIDILVNNAASIPPIEPFVEVRRDVMENAVKVNVIGTLELCRLLVPDLLARSNACIVNMASESTFMPIAFLTTYITTKAAIASFTENLRQELWGSSVHLLRVEPGPIRSEGYLETDQSLLPQSGRPKSAVDPAAIARKIVEAINQKKKELYFPPVPRMAVIMKALIPGTLRSLTARDQQRRLRKYRKKRAT